MAGAGADENPKEVFEEDPKPDDDPKPEVVVLPGVPKPKPGDALADVGVLLLEPKGAC